MGVPCSPKHDTEITVVLFVLDWRELLILLFSFLLWFSSFNGKKVGLMVISLLVGKSSFNQLISKLKWTPHVLLVIKTITNHLTFLFKISVCVCVCVSLSLYLLLVDRSKYISYQIIYQDPIIRSAILHSCIKSNFHSCVKSKALFHFTKQASKTCSFMKNQWQWLLHFFLLITR